MSSLEDIYSIIINPESDHLLTHKLTDNISMIMYVKVNE